MAGFIAPEALPSQPRAAHAQIPAARVGWGFVTLLALAYAGTWLALLTPVLVTVALRVRELAPDTAAASLSLVFGIGACFALVGNPVFGRLSDRTVSRFGMRRPWMLGGMLAGSGALLLIALAPNVGVVLIGWCLAQLAFNAVLATVVAVLPDHVPPEQRGTVAGVLGMCMPVGQVGGTFLVQTVAGSTLMMFMAPAVIGSVAVLLLVLRLPDRRLQPGEVEPFDPREWVRSLYIDPRRHPDFAWTWLSRFLFVTGTAFLSTYQPFFLIDKLGHSAASVPGLIFTSTLVQATMIVVASPVSGRLSDALSRRKPFVVGAAAAYATGLWLIAASDTFTTFLVGVAVTGVGQGVYFAVDLALVTQLLPNRQRDAAKDLGLFNIANALPQSVAPAIAPAILALSGGDYVWLFIVAGGIAFLGSIAILPLRTVR